MHDKFDNIAIALAGMIQAVNLIKELTQTGKMNDAAFEASIYSIFQTDPLNAPSVFGDLAGIKFGLEKLRLSFSTPRVADPLQSRYLLSLIHLQKKLARSPAILSTLTQRLNQIKKQVAYFSLTHPTVIANLGDIYLTTISTFKFRIMIVGNQRILTIRENMEKVRALLLAGMRSTVMWRQVGGSRLQLLFARKSIAAAAEKLLIQIENHSMLHKDAL